MAVLLGKRKRREQLERDDHDSDNESTDEASAKALFQRAFEAKFKPLPSISNNTKQTAHSDTDDDKLESTDDDDDWSGISEQAPTVEVVQVSNLSNGDVADGIRSRELKAFMSSKIPTSTDQRLPKQKPAKTSDDQDQSEEVNLKNDIALQRLLKESHLLEATAYSTTGASVLGKSRLKALDLRIQDLGGKGSHLDQKNMPLSHRRGIEAKTVDRERKRRKEAAENGIILERAKAAVKSTEPRQKSIGGPSIGRFQGGMLKLSGKDVRSIENTRSSVRGRKRGRGR